MHCCNDALSAASKMKLKIREYLLSCEHIMSASNTFLLPVSI
jgi:hypothetical protein